MIVTIFRNLSVSRADSGRVRGPHSKSARPGYSSLMVGVPCWLRGLRCATLTSTLTPRNSFRDTSGNSIVDILA